MVIWYQILWTNLNDLNRSTWLKDGILTGTTAPSQNEPGTTDNEGIFNIHQSFRTGVSQPDVI